MLDFNPLNSHGALLVVDCQESFCGDGAPYVSLVPYIKELVTLCRENKVHIFWGFQEHFEEDVTRKLHRIPTHLEKRGIKNPAYRGSKANELASGLQEVRRPEDYSITKHRMSMLYCTNLEVKLRMLDVRTVIVCGVVANACVESTIRDAYARDFDILLPRECTAGPYPDLVEATLKNVDIYFGKVVSLAELRE